MGPITPVHPSAFGPGSEVLRFPLIRGPWMVGINVPPFSMSVMPFSCGLTFPRRGSVRHLKEGFNKVGRSKLCQPPPCSHGDHSRLQCDLGRQSQLCLRLPIWRVIGDYLLCAMLSFTHCVSKVQTLATHHMTSMELHGPITQLDCFYLLQILSYWL